jgi:hypothetical protein
MGKLLAVLKGVVKARGRKVVGQFDIGQALACQLLRRDNFKSAIIN